MIHIERSTDYELIRRIMAHPAVYRHLTDDASPPVAEFSPIENDAYCYLVAWEGNELLGLWLLVPVNAVCWEIHTALLPNAWGDRALGAAAVMLEWVWGNTHCRRIITHVPAPNRLAYRFALAAGLKVFGIDEQSFLKNGELHDQICLGINRPREAAEVSIPGDSSLVAASTGPKE
jgi:RimJ/RimL family protein N-acetyltransferase